MDGVGFGSNMNRNDDIIINSDLSMGGNGGVGSSSLFGAFFRKRWVKGVLVVDALVLVAIVVILVLNAMKSSVIRFNVTPIDAKILVNGDEYTNGEYKFAPGKYKVEISHEGMRGKTFEVDLAGKNVVYVTTFLVGEDGGFEYYTLNGNYASFFALAQMVPAGNNTTLDHDMSAEEFVAEYQEQYGLYMSGVLPIRYSEYDYESGRPQLAKDITIMMDRDGNCRLALCVRALMNGTDDKNLINQLMSKNGLKTEDYEVNYKIY